MLGMYVLKKGAENLSQPVRIKLSSERYYPMIPCAARVAASNVAKLGRGDDVCRPNNYKILVETGNEWR